MFGPPTSFLLDFLRPAMKRLLKLGGILRT